MVYQVVVTDGLTEEMKMAGKLLTESLDAANIQVSAAFWLYIPESSVWRLIIATPLVTQLGPKETYGKVQDVINKTPEPRIRLQDIGVVDPQHELVSLLRNAIQVTGVSGTRFSQNVINDHIL